MSFGSKPQVTQNDPYQNMPDWVKVYYQNQIANAGQSDNRADALRLMFSGFNQPEHDAVHAHKSTVAAPPPPQRNSTADALARLIGGSSGSGGSSDGMWSDGMTASEVRQHQADRTFGATPRASAPTPQETYDRQMAQYTSNPGISVGGGRTPAEAVSNAHRR